MGPMCSGLRKPGLRPLEAAGLGYAAMTAMGVDMPVVSLHLDYRQPLRHGDEVCVESRCPGQQGVRWPWISRFVCGDAVVAEASVNLVMVREGRVLRRVPAQLQEVMDQLVRQSL